MVPHLSQANQSSPVLNWLTTPRIAWLALIACLTWLFYPGLFFSEVPAFRDAYHFYYPQAVWLSECAANGELFPRWNSQEGIGNSVAGQGSTALYYPLRFLWMLPGLSVAQCMSLFVLVHLIISALGAATAARKLFRSEHAAGLAAISYSLSCPILFQHSNLIYLTSAAWIGFALTALIDLRTNHTGPNWRNCLGFAMAVSMMVLGGDLHTAVNTLIVATLIIGIGIPPALRRVRSKTALHAALKRIGWLAIATSLAIALTAVQWIPMWRWAKHSQRIASQSNEQETLSLAPPLAHATPVEELVDSAPPVPHRVYDFSLAPWYLATVFWPTLGGHYLPSNSRLFSLLSAEGRMWIPSLYFGFLPCLFLFASWKHQTSRWLFGIAGFALLASMGMYSLVWFARESANLIGIGQSFPWPLDPVGSPYWMLTQVVPGYQGFRYPAKWTVWVVAACTLASSGHLATWTPQHGPLNPRWLVVFLLGTSSILACFFAGTLAVAYLAPDTVADLASFPEDRWLGKTGIIPALTSGLLASLIPILITLACRAKRMSTQLTLLTLTLLEMTCVASQFVTYVEPPSPSALRRELPPQAFVWFDASEARFEKDDLQRNPAAGNANFTYRQTRYQNTFLLGKLNQIAGVRSLSAIHSLSTTALRVIRRELARRDQLDAQQLELDNLLRQLGVTHRLVRKSSAESSVQFSWQSIADPLPLCTSEPAQATEENPPAASKVQHLSWDWGGSSQLDIYIECEVAQRICVRQFNDGGWIARDKNQNRLQLSNAPSVFLEITVPSGATHVSLSRKILW